MQHRRITLIATVALLGVASCGDEGPTATLTSPSGNAAVAGGVALAMTADGVTIEPAGEVRGGSGHFHVIARRPPNLPATGALGCRNCARERRSATVIIERVAAPIQRSCRLRRHTLRQSHNLDLSSAKILRWRSLIWLDELLTCASASPSSNAITTAPNGPPLTWSAG